MNYIELKVTVPEQGEWADILTAFLGDFGFDGFSEEDCILTCYIEENNFHQANLQELLNNVSSDVSFPYEWKIIPDQNWNAVWESNFEPVIIDNRCLVRAPFHPASGKVPFELVIEPKMSFGTAHHETTHMMVMTLLDMEVAGLTFLDMGCGTGILAILAEMKKAANIVAIDNDSWAYENSLENVQRNSCVNIQVIEGDADNIPPVEFDVIFANINRNILLRDMKVYKEFLSPGGILVMSGYYTNDRAVIGEEAERLNFKNLGHLERNNWACETYQLIS